MPHIFEQPWPEGEYKYFQLGFVVDDIVAAAHRWVSTFGVGPFHVVGPVRSAYARADVTANVVLKIAVAQAGPVQIELIQQVCDTPSIFRDFLRDGRGALHQLCTLTADYDQKLADFAQLGYEVASSLVARGQRVAFIDTEADFGFYTEVVEATDEFVDNLTAIARTCSQWDGQTDPVRLITRDGYRVP